MSTLSSIRNLFPPLDNPELTIRRRTRVDPNLLNDFNMATNRNGDDIPPAGGGDLPVPDLRTMEELCQPTLNGGTFMKRRPKESCDLIENMTAHHNDWDTFSQRMERETEVTKEIVPHTNNESTKDVQPPVVQIETQVPNSKPVVEPVEAPVSALKPNPKPPILYPSRLHDQKLHDKANDQKEKIFQIFQDLNFDITFMNALILMPKFGLTIKSLLTNKEKLFELAITPLNEHCSAVLLKKLPKKLEDPGKFLILCDFPGMDECLALADLGASINLMPLSVWKMLSLPELSPTCMTLELADRSVSHSLGVAKDVFVKTRHALIDGYEGELTLRVCNKAVTFNLDQTLRYFANYDAESINRIDVIDVACEEYSQEVLRFSMSGNPTPSTKPIVLNSSPTLTPYGDNLVYQRLRKTLTHVLELSSCIYLDDRARALAPS
nr:reverse transcriptase domain-containing protein [Tanacetum cinerariifolium]